MDTGNVAKIDILNLTKHRQPERMPLRWHGFAETVYGRIDHPPVRAEHPPTAIEWFCVKEPCEHPR
jgi:hypothetical protein